MTQKEAALFVGLSVRSLQRYVRDGRLSVRYEQGKTRPVPIYQTEELELLKKELFFRPVFPQSGNAQQAKSSFGLRLPPATLEKLQQEAAQYGMRPSEYARHLVQLGLEGAVQSDVEKLHAEVLALQQQLAGLQRTFSTFKKDMLATTEVVLEFSGMNANEARRWVASNLRVKH